MQLDAARLTALEPYLLMALGVVALWQSVRLVRWCWHACDERNLLCLFFLGFFAILAGGFLFVVPLAPLTIPLYPPRLLVRLWTGGYAALPRLAIVGACLDLLWGYLVHSTP